MSGKGIPMGEPIDEVPMYTPYSNRDVINQ